MCVFITAIGCFKKQKIPINFISTHLQFSVYFCLSVNIDSLPAFIEIHTFQIQFNTFRSTTTLEPYWLHGRTDNTPVNSCQLTEKSTRLNTRKFAVLNATNAFMRAQKEAGKRGNVKVPVPLWHFRTQRSHTDWRVPVGTRWCPTHGRWRPPDCSELDYLEKRTRHRSV